jgi:pimeloyl-ACP methyl ester carboxylesterase
LHGILGSLKNWKTPARRILSASPHYQALLVDHRGHGASEAGAPPHTLHACAADVKELLRSLNLRCDMLCGHSYGGKVALAYVKAGLEDRQGACVHACDVFVCVPNASVAPAPTQTDRERKWMPWMPSFCITGCMQSAICAYPPNPRSPALHPHTEGWEVPRQTWILDSLPGAVHRDRAIGEHSVAQVIEALARVPMPQPTKEGLVHRLVHTEKIPPFIAHWLMTSLQRHPGHAHGAAGGHHTGGYVWAFDLDVVRQLFDAYSQECFYQTLASPFLSADSHRIDFIRAGKNAAWTPEVLREFDALRAKGRCVRAWVGGWVGWVRSSVGWVVHWFWCLETAGSYACMASLDP